MSASSRIVRVADVCLTLRTNLDASSVAGTLRLQHRSPVDDKIFWLRLAFKLVQLLWMAVQKESFRNSANKYKITGLRPSFLSRICSKFDLPWRNVVSSLENRLATVCSIFF